MNSYKNDNSTIDSNVIKAIEFLECKDFIEIKNDILNSCGFFSNIETFINAKTRTIDDYSLPELIPSFFNFDYKSTNKFNDLIFGSDDNISENMISYKLDNFNLASYEISINLYHNINESLTFRFLDYFINISPIKSERRFIEFNSDKFRIERTLWDIHIEIDLNIGHTKKHVLSKCIPYMYRKHIEIRVVKVSEYFFFIIDDMFLGSYLINEFNYNYSNQDFISIATKEKKPFITISDFVIKEIVQNDIKYFVEKLINFKSKSLFYISIRKDYMETDGFDRGWDHTYIEKIDDFDSAKENIEIYSSFIPQYSRADLSYYTNWIVSNDYSLINKYRNAIEINDLVDISKLNDDDVLFHFSLVLFGMCAHCRTILEGGNSWTDPTNGVTYSYGSNDGWLIRNN